MQTECLFLPVIFSIEIVWEYSTNSFLYSTT